MTNMNEKDNNSTSNERFEHLGGSDCCPPGSSQDCCSEPGNSKSSRKSRGRMALFVAVILAAVVVGGYSIWQKSNAGIQDPGCCPGGTSSAMASLPKSVARQAADKDAVFVLLASENDKWDKAAARSVEQVVNKLEATGKQVAAFPLERHGKAYNELVKKYAVASFPCVMVMGKNPEVSKISGTITEKKLLYAYAQTSKITKGCGVSCDPSACGRK